MLVSFRGWVVTLQIQCCWWWREVRSKVKCARWKIQMCFWSLALCEWVSSSTFCLSIRVNPMKIVIVGNKQEDMQSFWRKIIPLNQRLGVLESGQCRLSLLHHGLHFEHLSHWCLSILSDDTIGNSQSGDEPVKPSQWTSQHVTWEFSTDIFLCHKQCNLNCGCGIMSGVTDISLCVCG
jgi:hypothetical protein